MEPYKKRKLWLVIGAAALIVIVLVILSLTQSVSNRGDNRIVLPSDTASEAAQTDDTADSRFAEISSDNVQTVIEGLSRADCYHQTLDVSAEFEGEVRRQTVEVWKSGSVFRITSEEPSGTRNLLTDGQTLYLWYQNDKTASQIRLDSTVSSDDLIGVPTYEDILKIPKQQIEEASFVVLPELNNASCVFISTASGDTADYFWVDFETGLLCKQVSLYQNAPLRTVRQTALVVYAEPDSVPESSFALPDETLPFSIRK